MVLFMNVFGNDSGVITIYQGFEGIVGVPEFGKGSPNNDYGLGFHTTRNKGLAG